MKCWCPNCKQEKPCECDESEEEERKGDEACFKILRAMKGKTLTDGGKIAGFTVTFTDKKTGNQRIVEI